MASATTTRSRTGSKRTKSTGRSGSTAKRKTKASTTSRSKSSTSRSRSTSSSRSTTARRSTARKASSRRRAASRRQKDVIALLKEDHREVEQMFRRYSKLGGRAEKSKKQIARDVLTELSKHAAVEEQILYPALREMVPRGEKMMDEGVQEHQTVKELLVDIDRMSPGDEEFDPKMTALIESVRHHVREEESEMFPKLRRSADRERLVQMGKMLEAAKKIAPTRPHPHAPSRPPANVVVGAVAGVVDRVRDLGREITRR